MPFGGLSQHVEFFYNPIGICCLTLVAIGLSREPRLDKWRSPFVWVLLLALAISGTNKLNFHGLTVSAAGVLILPAWADGRLSSRRMGRQLLILSVVAVVVPFAFEILWTGVTPAHWFAEVVTRPTARFQAATHFFDPLNFVRPPTNFHHHILIPALGGIGLLVLIVTGGASVWITRSSESWLARGFRLCLIGGSIAGTAWSMVTNYETLSLTSLPFLIVAFAIGFGLDDQLQGTRWLRLGLLVAALPWIVNGAYSAWFGSRVLYGVTPPDRSTYERLTDAPHALSYFEGVQFARDQLASHRHPARSTHCRVRVHVQPSANHANAPIILALCSVRDGRYQIPREVQISAADPQTIEIDGWMPESEDWIVLQARPAGSNGDPLQVTSIEWLEP